MAIAVAGFLGTFTYYARRSMHVEVKQRSPWWMWPAMGLWGALAGLLAWGLDDRLAFSYALAGLVAAAPLLVWGLHLRKAV